MSITNILVFMVPCSTMIVNLGNLFHACYVCSHNFYLNNVLKIPMHTLLFLEKIYNQLLSLPSIGKIILEIWKSNNIPFCLT